MESNQLPADAVSQITQSAVEYANLLVFYSTDVQAAWEAGATEYATKLHQVQQENEELKRQNEKLKETAKLACSLGRNYNPKK